jgi:hypothetical protein
MNGMRRRVAVVSLTALALAAAGCTADQSDTDAAGNGSASITPPFDCPADPVAPVGAEQAARCLYEGWITTDEGLVSSYGDDGVTDGLPVVMDDPKMTWEGCSDDGASVLDGHVCTWRGVFADGEVTLEMGVTGTPAGGFRVSEIEVVR